MSSLQRKLIQPQRVLCRHTSKRYDTSAYNWHKIRVYEGPLRCPTSSISWAPRFPLVGGREAPRITKPAYESLPEEENLRLLKGPEGVQRIDTQTDGCLVRAVGVVVGPKAAWPLAGCWSACGASCGRYRCGRSMRSGTNR